MAEGLLAEDGRLLRGGLGGGEEAVQRQSLPPALLPHSTMPGAGQAQPVALRSPIRVAWRRSPVRPICRDQDPGLGRAETWAIKEERTVLPGEGAE